MARWHDWIDGYGWDTLGRTKTRPVKTRTDEECFPLVLDRDGDLYHAASHGGWTISTVWSREGMGEFDTLDELDQRWGPLTALDVR